MRFKRVCLVILDSLGVGELPDAASYGDEGANTLKHLEDHLGTLKIPNLSRLGLAHVGQLSRTQQSAPNEGYYGRMVEVSRGKDTTTGHWEMMGLPLENGLSLFENEFPKDLLDEFLKRTGLNGYLGNKAASGTVIIEELGEEHLRTGFPIVYTSADSVFQIAWHEEKFGLQKLYEVCEITRTLLDESSYKIGRVIALPFVGSSKENFKRTGNRRDFSLKPPKRTVLSELKEQGVQVFGVGKIPYIFDFEGISTSL